MADGQECLDMRSVVDHRGGLRQSYLNRRYSSHRFQEDAEPTLFSISTDRSRVNRVSATEVTRQVGARSKKHVITLSYLHKRYYSMVRDREVNTPTLVSPPLSFTSVGSTQFKLKVRFT